MLVSELAELYLTTRGKFMVDRGYKRGKAMAIVLKWWGARDISTIGQDDFDKYAIEEINSGKKPSTIRQRLGLLLSVLHFGVRYGYREAFVPFGMPAGRPPRYEELTLDEAGRLLRYAVDVETRCFIAIALLTGARREAICELTWDRVDLEAGVLDFNTPHTHSHRRKGRAVLPITKVLTDFLVAYRAFDTRPSHARVCRWCMEGMNEKVLATGRRAGIGRPVTTSTLRHTAAMRMLRAVPPIYASRALGHLTVKTTENVYRQSTAETLRPAALVLNNLLVANEI